MPRLADRQTNLAQPGVGDHPDEQLAQFLERVGLQFAELRIQGRRERMAEYRIIKGRSGADRAKVSGAGGKAVTLAGVQSDEPVLGGSVCVDGRGK